MMELETEVILFSHALHNQVWTTSVATERRSIRLG